MKTLNTMNAEVMVHPDRVPGEHVVFVAGDDGDAKAAVAGLLGELGWTDGRIVDLGGLTAARGLEAFVLLWWSIAQAHGPSTSTSPCSAADLLRYSSWHRYSWHRYSWHCGATALASVYSSGSSTCLMRTAANERLRPPSATLATPVR